MLGNSFECLLPYTELDAEDFLVNFVRKSFIKIYFTLKSIYYNNMTL